MIKRLLSLVTAFVAFCCIANAQAFQRNEAGLGLKYNKIEKMAPTRAAAEGRFLLMLRVMVILA